MNFFRLGRPQLRLGLQCSARRCTHGQHSPSRDILRDKSCTFDSVILHATHRSPLLLHVGCRRLRWLKRTRKPTGRCLTSPREGASAGFDALAIRSNHIFRSLEISNSWSSTSKACSTGEPELLFIRARSIIVQEKHQVGMP